MTTQHPSHISLLQVGTKFYMLYYFYLAIADITTARCKHYTV